MSKTSTQKDLVRYAYNETDLKDADRIQRAIDGDPLVADDYQEITDVLEMLDGGKVQLSDASAERILKRLKKVAAK